MKRVLAIMRQDETVSKLLWRLSQDHRPLAGGVVIQTVEHGGQPIGYCMQNVRFSGHQAVYAHVDFASGRRDGMGGNEEAYGSCYSVLTDAIEGAHLIVIDCQDRLLDNVRIRMCLQNAVESGKVVLLAIGKSTATRLHVSRAIFDDRVERHEWRPETSEAYIEYWLRERMSAAA